MRISAKGAGIFLLRSGQEHKLQPSDKYVVQRYIHKPLLLDGYKFDLRLYVLVTSVDPLRCYLFTDGLARFCTQQYAPPNSKNMDQVYMHLTNYSLNKFNKEGFVKNDEDNGECASKRSVHTVIEQVYIYVYIHFLTGVNIYICVYIHMCIHVYTIICIHIYVCVYIYICICIYT